MNVQSKVVSFKKTYETDFFLSWTLEQIRRKTIDVPSAVASLWVLGGFKRYK